MTQRTGSPLPIDDKAKLQSTIQELTAKLRALERSNGDLHQYASVASHDLQEPLRTIAGYCAMLSNHLGEKLDDESRMYLDFVTESAKRLQLMVKDLLAYSSVGTVESACETVDCALLLHDTLEELRIPIAESKAKVTCGKLPAVQGQRLQIQRVFQNLIGNAIKFHDGRPPEVHVSAEREKDRWVFTVQDNGIGIEAEYFDKIFDVFRRLHGREAYPGTGIGLSLCKKIIENHGGEIWVESTPGVGSRFRFTLPAAAEARLAA